MSNRVLKNKEPFASSMISVHLVLTFWISFFVILAMVLAAILLYIKFSNTLTNIVRTNSIQMVEQVAGTLNSYIEGMISISDQIIETLNTNSVSDREQVENILNAAYKHRNDIVSIAIFENDGSPIAYIPNNLNIKKNVDIKKQHWYLSAIINKGKYYFSSPHVQNIFEKQYRWVVTISRSIYPGNNTIPEASVLVIDMNFNSMEESCNKITIGSRGYAFILDENNSIIYHPQQQIIYSNIKQENVGLIGDNGDGVYTDTEGDRIVVVRSLKHTNWKLIGISYLSDAKATRDDVINFVGALLAIAILFVIAIANIMSRKITDPIVKLTEVMGKVEEGNLEIRADENSYLEVSCLGKSFNHMIDRINKLMEQIKAEQQELRKSELKALQAQINPHFLYNTLDSIAWMCERNKGDGAVIMVQALANLFRYSISKGNEITTVRDELNHAENYFIIQKIRFKDQFDYVIEADESAMSCITLNIILQPIIENAIYHGINMLVDKGKIHVKVKDLGDSILMQVSDNGVGMPEKVLKSIFEQEAASSYGIGVKNVHNRIQIYFGKNYGLSFKSELDVGTTVNIRIPRIERKDWRG